MSRPTDGFSATMSLMGLSIRKGRADTSAGEGHESRRASSLSIRALSKPTIQAFPILMTGTPLCPVFLTRSRAAFGSLSTLISLKETPLSRKYFFARRHHEHVEVLKITGLVTGGPPYRSSSRLAQLAAHHHHAAGTRVLVPLHGHAYAVVGGGEPRGRQVQIRVAALVDGEAAGADVLPVLFDEPDLVVLLFFALREAPGVHADLQVLARAPHVHLGAGIRHLAHRLQGGRRYLLAPHERRAEGEP